MISNIKGEDANQYDFGGLKNLLLWDHASSVFVKIATRESYVIIIPTKDGQFDALDGNAQQKDNTIAMIPGAIDTFFLNLRDDERIDLLYLRDVTIARYINSPDEGAKLTAEARKERIHKSAGEIKGELECGARDHHEHLLSAISEMSLE